jgi:methylase of polypeptide subunit release factors
VEIRRVGILSHFNSQHATDYYYCTIPAADQVKWTLATLPPDKATRLRILDIGTGNGILPITLIEAGYNPEEHVICGVDYSEGAIELARQVAHAHNVPVSVPSKEQERESKQEIETGALHFYCQDFIHGDEDNDRKWNLL